MFNLPEIDSMTLEGYRLLREGAGLIDLPHFAALELTGDDRRGWLQGQVTSDLRNLADGGSVAFCMCKPTGQLLAFGTVWDLPDRFILTIPVRAIESVLERVEQMVILEDVAARIIQGPTLISIQGPRASMELQDLVKLPALDAGTFQDGLWLRSNRTGLGGWDVLASAALEKELRGRFRTVAASAYDIARLEAGIPIFGTDTTPKTLPPEIGPAFVETHISYTKGCYTGQEVIMRIHSRGHTNRTWMGLIAEGQLRSGDLISAGDLNDAGSITSCALSPAYGPVGAAYVRNEAAHHDAAVVVHSSSGEVLAKLQHMPLLTLA